jgi:hypothetical protein
MMEQCIEKPLAAARDGRNTLLSQWRRACSAFFITILCGLLGCASGPGSGGNSFTNSGLTQSEVSAISNRAPGTCDSDDDVLPPMDEPNPPEMAAEITRNLNDHCLPLVRASAAKASNGQPEIMLYGFVASYSAKHEAEVKATQMMEFAGMPLKDAIMVRPELASATTAANPANIGNTTENGNTAGQQMVIQQYQNQQQNGSTLPLVSTLMGLGMIGNVFQTGTGVLVTPAIGSYPIAPGYSLPPGSDYPGYPGGLGAGSYPGGFRPFP